MQAISRVQAIQRGGRAGRTAAGECFRLYTKRYFDHEMRDVSPPEILRTPLAAAVLHLKSLPAALGIDVLRFDFVDSPPRAALEEALRQLHLLGALDAGVAPAASSLQARPDTHASMPCMNCSHPTAFPVCRHAALQWRASASPGSQVSMLCVLSCAHSHQAICGGHLQQGQRGSRGEQERKGETGQWCARPRLPTPGCCVRGYQVLRRDSRMRAVQTARSRRRVS